MAALAGTMAANVFYLTMTFYYFFVFLMLALVVPIVFGSALPRRTPAPEPARTPRTRRGVRRRPRPLTGPSPA
jgi:hypothetical protein